jgi:glycosyltransferase involved in cell wall biosynthesis
MNDDNRLKVLFIGAFPEPGSDIFGGNVTDCARLMESTFPTLVALTLVDSTQKSVPPPPLRVRAGHAVGRIARALVAFEKSRPDVLFIISSSGFSFIEKASFVWYARIRGVPAILSIRSGHFMDLCRTSSGFRILAKHLVRGAALLLCQGERWQEFYCDVLRVPKDRCSIVNGWTASEQFLALGRSRSGPSVGHLSILFVGWIEPFKGVFDLLEAVKVLARDKSMPTFRVTLAGQGGSYDEARRWVESEGLAERVLFTGWVQDAERQALLQSADLFVLPSHTEGLPNALIEAMAAGLPVVATDVGSIPDVVTTGSEGILIRPKDVVALETALRELLTNPETRREMGIRAHATAERLFSVNTAARELKRLLVATSVRAVGSL